MPHWYPLSRLSENWLDARPPKFYSVRIRTLIGTTRQPDRKRLTSTSVCGQINGQIANQTSDSISDQILLSVSHIQPLAPCFVSTTTRV
jgi:hypothetical protein